MPSQACTEPCLGPFKSNIVFVGVFPCLRLGEDKAQGCGRKDLLVLCMMSVGPRAPGLKGLGMCPWLNQHGNGLFADYCPCATALVDSMLV